MKHSQLKALLHRHNEMKRAKEKENKLNDKADQHLTLNYVSLTENKGKDLTGAFNEIRRKNVKEVLNKFIHPFSQHIRLKPYYDAGTWLHWIGVLSDLTLPNANDNLNGDLLIDKLTTGDHKELLDFHVWLNLENVKYIKSKKQKIGIGDIIEGESKILRYNKNKYGLGTTVIHRAGIYQGHDEPEDLVGKYDRQDDWVIEIDNSSASDRAWDAYQESNSMSEFENEPGHVEVRYQPSRYQRYRERLHEMKRETSESVLPLVSSQLANYKGEVSQIHAVKSPAVSYRVPQLQLKNVTNEHGRLVAANVNLPYTQEMKKMGELEPGDKVTFESRASADGHYLFGIIDKFTLQTKHEYYPLPEFPNTFLGYLMWKNPEEGMDPSLVINYENWALARNIHTDEIKEDIAESVPERPLTEHEMAIRFGVTDAVISSAYKQGIIKPLAEEEGTRAYDVDAWKTLMQLLSAQDPHSVQNVKDAMEVYSEDDLCHKFNLTIDEVRSRIKKAGFLPLNGFHYKINLYGPKVYQMFKTSQTIKASLPPKNNIRVQREIPRDKDYTKHFVDRPVALPAKIEIKALPAPEANQINHEEKKIEKQAKEKRTILLEISTFDGYYYSDEFKDFEDADDFIEKTAVSKFTNQFLHVVNVKTGEKEVISTKAIISFKQKKE